MRNKCRPFGQATTMIRSLLHHGQLTAVVAMLLVTIVVLCGTAQADIIFVTSLEQKISETGGCSLQEAIYSANFDNNIAIVGVNADGTDRFLTDSSGQLAHTQCVPGRTQKRGQAGFSGDEKR